MLSISKNLKGRSEVYCWSGMGSEAFLGSHASLPSHLQYKTTDLFVVVDDTEEPSRIQTLPRHKEALYLYQEE
jgi:hypothetical protein